MAFFAYSPAESSGGGLEASNFTIGEVPTGDIDGANTDFTLAATPVSGTLAVYYQGQRLPAAQVTDNEDGTFTLGFAPASGTTLTCDYQTA